MLLFLAAAHAETVAEAFPPPEGAARAQADAFGAYLRALPLHPDGREVLTYDGRPVAVDAARVVSMPVGTRDLQPCADSALRLRASWERAAGRAPAFHYTSGDLSAWAAWANGSRPKISGNDVTFVAGAAKPDASDAAFEAWMMNLFTYAGTRSLPLDTMAVAGNPAEGVEILLAVWDDGSVTALNGHVDLGTGIRTALSQLVADELDVALSQVHTVLGSTAGRITVFLLLVGVVVGGRLFRRLRKRK